jgi:hypothetical protein
MKFRFKALGWHFCASTCLLLAVVGALYLGWYRWPGWYLASMLTVLPITVGVDAALGPLMTFIIANPNKPRRELARDIAIIGVVQLTALVYGAQTLWHGRPLYYAFSVGQLEVVQASDLDPAEVAFARQQKLELAPHWYSLPRWIYAPLPADEKKSGDIIRSTITGGSDVTDMPRYFQPWANSFPELRKDLKKVDDWGYFSKKEKTLLKERMQERGFAVDAAATIPLTGRDRPLLAVFDLSTLKIEALILAKP